ncbi:MAG: hypothetical protein FWD83_05250 [Promicromonosporaceae bacterium]|nr:hypothetical protein [Promicromonosporaceae bacterium]
MTRLDDGHVRINVRPVDAALARMQAITPGLAPGEPGTADPELVQQALDALPSDDRQMLWLKHVESADDHTVAAAMSISLGTVQRRLRKAERAMSHSFAGVHARVAASLDGACATTRGSLGEYSRHRVHASRRRVLEAHLFGCEECMRAFIDIRESAWSLRDAAPLLLAGLTGLAAVGGTVASGAAVTTSGGTPWSAFCGQAVDAVREAVFSVGRGALIGGGATAGVVTAAAVTAAVAFSGGSGDVAYVAGGIYEEPPAVVIETPVPEEPTPSPEPTPIPEPSMPPVVAEPTPTPTPTPSPTHQVPVRPRPQPTMPAEPAVPEPAPEIAYTPEPTPAPEAAPEPTSTPEPTPIPSPTPESAPTSTPEPEATSSPTPTVTPPPSPSPTSTPTPEPSVPPVVVEPTVTPTPEPTPSAEPTLTPPPVTGVVTLILPSVNALSSDYFAVVLPGYFGDASLSPAEVGAVSQNYMALPQYVTDAGHLLYYRFVDSIYLPVPLANMLSSSTTRPYPGGILLLRNTTGTSQAVQLVLTSMVSVEVVATLIPVSFPAVSHMPPSPPDS